MGRSCVGHFLLYGALGVRPIGGKKLCRAPFALRSTGGKTHWFEEVVSGTFCSTEHRGKQILKVAWMECGSFCLILIGLLWKGNGIGLNSLNLYLNVHVACVIQLYVEINRLGSTPGFTMYFNWFQCLCEFVFVFVVL